MTAARAALACLALAACAARGQERERAPAAREAAGADAAGAGAAAVPPAAPAAPPERAGCGAAKLLVAAEDPAAAGPWPVGVRTLTLAGLRVEVWYPALPGSVPAGATPVAYDLAEELPPATAEKLRAAGVVLPAIPCACYRDLPLDEAHGPYPPVLYAHGLTLFRFASVTMTAHWASRGYIVLAPDFPDARLADVLAARPRPSNGAVAADAARVLDAAVAQVFPGHVDWPHLGLTGHSLGGEVASRLAASRGEVVVPMAERGVEPVRGRTFRTVVIGGTEDRVEPFVRQERGFAASPEPKQLVAIEGAGHMSFTDVCSVARERGGLYAVAHAAGVRMDGFLAALADHGCAQTKLTAEEAWPKIVAATTAALAPLQCADGAAAAPPTR